MSHVPASLIHAQQLLPYAEFLDGGGAPAARLLEVQQIPPEAIRDPGAKITMWQAYRFVEASAKHVGLAELGLSVGRNVSLSDFGPLGEALRSAPTLAHATSTLSSAMNELETGSSCWIETEARGVAWICYRPLTRFAFESGQAEQFDLQCLLSVVHLATGKNWVPEAIRICGVPECVLRGSAEFAHCRIEKTSQTTAIAFPERLLAKALGARSHDPSADPQSEPSQIGPQLSIADAVEQILHSLSEHEPLPILEAMAERFGLSGRTLQRALDAEGTSYRDLSDRLLFSRAARLLGQLQLLLKAISAELGYSSAASFVRAFRRYTGVTPNAFRNAMNQRT